MRESLSAISLSLFVFFAMGSSLVAHDSLYHYIEVHPPREEGSGEIIFSVHAADLPLARNWGVDPLGQDLEWLRQRSDAEIEAVFAEAREFLSATFSVTSGETVRNFTPESLRFPTAAQWREQPDEGEGARPGFLAGVLVLSPEAGDMRVEYAKSAGKRLLLVLHRPGAFPLVKDLAPGETAPLSFQSLSP